MNEEKCEHESLRPIAYSSGEHFVNGEELVATPYAIVMCSDCGLVTFGWLRELED